jgi:hypothetical protein
MDSLLVPRPRLKGHLRQSPREPTDSDHEAGPACFQPRRECRPAQRGEDQINVPASRRDADISSTPEALEDTGRQCEQVDKVLRPYQQDRGRHDKKLAGTSSQLS